MQSVGGIQCLVSEILWIHNAVMCNDTKQHGKETIIYKKKYRSDLITHTTSATQLGPKP